MNLFFSKAISVLQGPSKFTNNASKKRCSLQVEALESRLALSGVSIMTAPTVGIVTQHMSVDTRSMTVLHPGNAVSLNPQPLPPGKLASSVDTYPTDPCINWGALNPQPLPPRVFSFGW